VLANRGPKLIPGTTGALCTAFAEIYVLLNLSPSAAAEILPKIVVPRVSRLIDRSNARVN
jgi:hypothetical protein